MPREMIDPEEYCVNCNAKISGRYRTCEFCGKVWWAKNDDGRSDEEAETRN